jgi:hypothetical protein
MSTWSERYLDEVDEGNAGNCQDAQYPAVRESLSTCYDLSVLLSHVNTSLPGVVQKCVH